MTKLDEILNDYRNNTTFLFMRYYLGNMDLDKCVAEMQKQNRIFKRKLTQIITGGLNDTNRN